MTDRAELSDIAQRCIDDPEFARGVLEGNRYPEVRAALEADLAADPEVEGYLNPQPLPPFNDTEALSRFRGDWSALTSRWSSLNFAQTRGIIIIGG
ncbi:MAG TPA: hypothetical protein VF005_00355 [Acidimicrobiales bacterium]